LVLFRAGDQTPSFIQKVKPPAMPIDPCPSTVLSDADLVLKFESLGDNCELGIVQRRVGMEPLGLLRFAGAPVRNLIPAMQARFEGLADPAQVLVQPENDEYMIKLAKYNFLYHAEAKIGTVDPRLLQQQQVQTVGFLVRKILEDLENPSKIMVFRQNEPLLADDLTDLRLALAAYGPATLLWVQEGRPDHPPGTVVKVDDRLMVGYVRRLASREDVPDLDVTSWLAMLREAYVLHADADRKPAAGPARTEVVFGRFGNAGGCTESGWSRPEDGFIWAIGKRSRLTIKNPGPAKEYWLEFNVKPFVAPPVLNTQCLTVTINGELVQVFDPLARGVVGCTVPGRLLEGRATVDIILDHPNAAIPKVVAGQKDDRELAISFETLSLTAS
jgi:hypothetical protein